MAVKKTDETVTTMNEAELDQQERVEIMIPRGAAGDDANYFVSVNGKSYLMPRGKKAMVPKCVAYEIRRSWAAQEAQEARKQQMIEAAQEAAAGFTGRH